MRSGACFAWLSLLLACLTASAARSDAPSALEMYARLSFRIRLTAPDCSKIVAGDARRYERAQTAAEARDFEAALEFAELAVAYDMEPAQALPR